MKRGAEKQIVRDDTEGDEIEEISSPGQGFKKASEATLASRPMKGMPKRGLSGSPANSPMPKTTSLPAVPVSSTEPSSPFGGFGNLTSNSSFSFTPPATPTASGFGGTAVASTASAATKTFASLLGTGGSAIPNKPATIPQQSNSKEDAAMKYFTSLRGLNVSFMAALSQAVEKDPFVDIAELMDRYKSLRVNVQTDFDNSEGGTGSTKPAMDNKPQPAMPVPPKNFAGFQLPGSSSSQASTPTPTFGSTSSTSTRSNFFAIPPTSSDLPASRSPFTFGGSNPGSSKEDAPLGTTSTNLFSSSTKTPSAFAGGALGASKFSQSDKSEGSSGNLANGTNVFGGSSGASVFKTSPSIGFGSFSPTTTPGAFGSKGSIGNPVGFAFGSPTPEPESRGDVDAKDDIEHRALSPTSQESGAITPADGDAEDRIKPLGSNPHDEEGEGEEDEETIHTVRVKCYKLKEGEAKREWADHGVGFLRLKKHKTTEDRRMLLRNSGNGKIIINFKLYSGLKPARSKNAVSFVGHEDGKTAMYRIRMKEEAQASAFMEVLDRELSQVRAKDQS
ncbi:hypothetical protein BD410DRAFT_895609 [Rickenella mellea]|uniref:RanBD1 domain-containing protein n=1 Tax=Rickenella mellea TaxID=50990 RepID=A0A4Y7QEV1_9AGAM|nr:hypothetical protein BD410DRAFT_895609 [Rickenella mellea]